jgi:hypothetical protein
MQYTEVYVLELMDGQHWQRVGILTDHEEALAKWEARDSAVGPWRLRRVTSVTIKMS